MEIPTDRVECDVAAFSGSVVVASMHKAEGLVGLANDPLRSCHRAARPIIGNEPGHLCDKDEEALCAGRLKAGPSFWEEFKGASFARRARGLIRMSRTNASKPSGLRKDVAHFAPGRTWVSREGGVREWRVVDPLRSAPGHL